VRKREREKRKLGGSERQYFGGGGGGETKEPLFSVFKFPGSVRKSFW
jgi:hypothetical protein